MNGACIAVETLIKQGVDVTFGFPGGAVIPLFDAFLDYKNKIRNILVRHEQCVSPDTKILVNETGLTEIRNLENNHSKVYSYDLENNKVVSSKITNFFKYNTREINKKVYRVTTIETEREIKATESHPFLTKEGWKNLGDIKVGERVAVYPHIEVYPEKNKTETIIKKEDYDESLNLCLKDKKAKEKVIDIIKNKNLLPLATDNGDLQILSRLVGHLFGDGCLSNPCYDRKRKEYAIYLAFTGNKNDLKLIKNDIEKLGFKTMPLTTTKRNSIVIRGRKKILISGVCSQFRCNSKPLWALFASLGVPIGEKTRTEYLIQDWIMDGSKQIKREFLAALFGSEGRNLKARTKKAFSYPDLCFHKVEEFENNAKKFTQQIRQLLSEFNIKTRELMIKRRINFRIKDRKYSSRFTISVSRKQDMLNFCKYVGFEYSIEKKKQCSYVLEYLEMCNKVYKKMKEKKQKTKKMYNEGFSRRQIINDLNITFGVLDNWIYRSNSCKKLPPSLIPNFKEWLSTVSESLTDGLVWETIEAIEEIKNVPLVMDFTVKDTHSFFANGFLVHNCAAHAAEGYARASGKAGVCIATSGPGATNLVTGIMDAYMDSVPIVAFGGQVPTALIGNDAFQETDMMGITLPITKHNFQVREPNKMAPIIMKAFKIALEGRPGPVYIDLPKDVQIGEVTEKPLKEVSIAGFQPTLKPNIVQIRKAAQAILNAERPLFLIGQGVIISNASKELTELANLIKCPVVTTFMGKGAFDERHPLCLGTVGMHGRKIANYAVINTDLLITIGCRFSDRITGNLKTYAENAKVIHADIDPAEIGKNVKADIPIVGDAKNIIIELTNVLKEMKLKENDEWNKKMRELKSRCDECVDLSATKKIHPKTVMDELNKILKPDDIVVTGVGQHQMFAGHFIQRSNPRTFISSGGAGTMGFGFPASIGAKIAKPDTNVFLIDGDGSFQMTIQELGTVKEANIKVIPIIINNSYLGMVRQWLELFSDKRYSEVYLGTTPDFVKVAEAYGLNGIRVERKSEFVPALKQALKNDTTTIVDVQVEEESNILPMLPPGGNLKDAFGGCIKSPGKFF